MELQQILTDPVEAFNQLGYKVQRISGKRIAVKTDEDRVSFLKELAKKYDGEYNPVMAASSTGGTFLPGGLVVLAKPIADTSAGAGTELTKLVESAQCFYCAAAWSGGRDYSPEMLKRVAKEAKTDATVAKVIRHLPLDWAESSRLIAERLKKEFGRHRFQFHRNSRWVQKLEQH